MRVASLGGGYFATFQISAWHRIEGVSLTGIADRDAARRAALAQAFDDVPILPDLAALLSRGLPDILDIATPPATHAALVRQAVDAGVRVVICQKPFCTDLEEAEALVSEVGSTAHLIVHENFRFQPWHREIRRLISAGTLGTVRQARFALRSGDGNGPDAYLARQPYFRDMPRFLIRETGIHMIDTFRYLFGPVRSVYADLRRLNTGIAGEDAGVVIFDHGQGVRTVFDGNRLLDHAAGNTRLTLGEMEVEGSAATVRLTGDGALHLRHFGAADWTVHPYTFEDRDFGGNCVELLQRAAIDALQTGKTPENTGAAYLENLRVEAAIYRSAETGRRISLEDA